MGNMMKQLGDMKKQMKELKKLVVEHSSKNEEVTVKCNGELKIIEIKIKEGTDVKQLPHLIRDTINQAFDNVKLKTVDQFKGLENFNLPGM